MNMRISPIFGKQFGPFICRPKLFARDMAPGAQGPSYVKAAQSAGVPDTKKKVEADVDAGVAAVKNMREAISDQYSPCAGDAGKKEVDLDMTVDAGVNAAKNARAGSQNVGYRETAIWQESMKRLGANAAKETIAQSNEPLNPGTTSEQRAAVEMGRKHAREILSKS